MHYKLKSGVDPFELNPGARAVKEFDVLTEMQFFAVCLIADSDHDNPIRTLPDKERREKACQIAGYQLETDGKRLAKNGREIVVGKIKNIENAIKKYQELQYNEDTEILRGYEKQIHETLEFIHMDKGNDPKLKAILLEKAANLSKQLPEIKEAKKKIEDMISVRNKVELTTYTSSDLQDSESTEGLSTLDRVMQKKQ